MRFGLPSLTCTTWDDVLAPWRHAAETGWDLEPFITEPASVDR